MSGPASVAVVVPTIGRPELTRLLASLAASTGPRPERIVIVDDRPRGASRAPLIADTPDDVEVTTSGGRGPAAARNAGWQQVGSDWVAFLDDDVVVEEGWLSGLEADLAAADASGAAASQGRLHVPLPSGRRPTDAERGTAGLQTAQWITADLAVRRVALSALGGFDERFPRAFREDADLGLRLRAAGYAIVQGQRSVTHPVRASRWTATIRQQRGNADDALMRRLHGPDWYARAGAAAGRRPRHAAIAAAGVCAVVAAAAGRRRVTAVAAFAWAAGTAEFAWARIAPGPRTPAEVTTMAATSAVIPVAAVGSWVAGRWAHRRARPWDAVRPLSGVLLDRDGTLVHDVPHNVDPDRVQPLAGTLEALTRLRAAGLPTAVVTNQPGVGSGAVSPGQLAAVHARVDDLLGPFDSWQVCPHTGSQGCACRKPAPRLLLEAAGALGVPAHRLVMVGDTQADLDAARSAGALGVLVPNPVTRIEEIAAARHVRADLGAVADFVLDRPRAGSR